MKIYIAADHKGLDYKKELIEYLKNNYEVEDIGLSNYELDDYTDFAFELGEKVSGSNSLGILICGNGIGMSIAANKVKGIRAIRAVSVDDAFKSRQHNGANVLCLGSNLDIELVKEIADRFINTDLSQEERYTRRTNKIINYENGVYNEL